MPRRLHRLTDFLAAVARRLFHRRPANLRRQRAQRPIRCWIERLEAREVFNATFHGGALIPHVEAQAVFLGTQWKTNTTLQTEAATIDNMLAYTVQSPYMDMLTDGGYNVGQGTATTGAKIDVALTTTTTDTAIRSLLQQAITLKLVQQPDANRLYFVYMPAGITVNNNGATSQVSFLGYHGAFAGSDANNVPFDIHYVVVPHPGTPNPTSASQGFTGVSEAESLTLGGNSGGTLTPALNGVAATTVITRTDELQTLTLGGTPSGVFTLSYAGTPAPATLVPKQEVQTLSVGGVEGGIIRLSYNGVIGTDVTKLTIRAGTSPTEADVKNHLASIAALAGNIEVMGPVGGPFTIKFINSLNGANASQIQASVESGATASTSTTTDGSVSSAEILASLNTIPALLDNVLVVGDSGGPFSITFMNALTGVNVVPIAAAASAGTTATIATPTDGASPTAPQVQTSLNTITGLTGNVTVTGNTGGPFSITVKGVGNISTLAVAATTGGLTGIFSAGTDGITSDLDQLTSVTSHELSEAVTDPDINYKTLGWYDDPNNVEIADLLHNAITDVPNNNIRLGPSGYLVQKVFDRTNVNNLVIPDTTSIAFNAALAGVKVTQISPTQLLVSWTPVDHGATGYRVFLENENGSAPILLSRVPRTASSTVITLPSLSHGKLKVEAYNAAHTTNLTEVPFTMDLPAVQKPVATAKQLMSGGMPVIGSALVTWTSPVPSGSDQVLTLGGTGAGSFTLAYNRSTPTVELNRVDEVQTLTVGGTDGGTIQLIYKGVAGSTATQLKFISGASPTATDVLNHLASIPELSTPGVLKVTGSVNGPFTITFTGGLSGVNVDQLTVATSGGATASVMTTTEGSAPSAADVQSALTTAAPSLVGHLAVTGNAGGPYFIQVTNSIGVVLVNVNSVSGGVTAAVNGDIGANGFRIFSVSGTTKKLVATLPGTATSATIAGLKAGSKVTFIVEAFRGSLKAASSQVSAQLDAATFTVTRKSPPPSPTTVELDWSWNTPNPGATGYRIYRVTSTGARVLVATRTASANSVLLSGFPANTKFVVQAVSGSTVLKTSSPV